jgi:hypothetical protein
MSEQKKIAKLMQSSFYLREKQLEYLKLRVQHKKKLAITIILTVTKKN